MNGHEIATRGRRALMFGLLLLGFFCPAGAAEYGGGEGTAEWPYLIYTAEQMKAIGLDRDHWSRHFRLMEDIDMMDAPGMPFHRIGDDWTAFTGVFDGNGKQIANLVCWSEQRAAMMGLFGRVEGRSARVRDLTLIEPKVSGGWYTGSLVGFLSGAEVSGCRVEGGDVWGLRAVGGLVGWNQGIVFACGSSSGVFGERMLGGLIGCNLSPAPLRHCFAAGDVAGYYDVGGLIGFNESWIMDCYARGDVRGHDRVGGLVGYHSSYADSCYSTGHVSGASDAGGLVGFCWKCLVADSFWDLQMSGQWKSAGGAGMRTADMQTIETYKKAAWNFLTPWVICEGAGYPRLRWQIAAGDFVCPEGVTLRDYSVLGWRWLSTQGSPTWDPALDISDPPDGIIDARDLAAFAENWLSNAE